ncbi:hypothetical protein [Streptomyces lanatus]|uniref:Integral membrane protein n=1 Tax=Streptomyces lanatus TaxID=66900 RepID=A0ABV1Y0Y0_9ACTN|nr:hypothetical protein [Streptomyces lanatus]
MSVDNNRPPPDNHGGLATVENDAGGAPTPVEEVVGGLVLIAMAFALLDVWVPLNLEAYFVSILGSLGGYLLMQSSGPEPPAGLPASLFLRPAL